MKSCKRRGSLLQFKIDMWLLISEVICKSFEKVLSLTLYSIWQLRLYVSECGLKAFCSDSSHLECTAEVEMYPPRLGGHLSQWSWFRSIAMWGRHFSNTLRPTKSARTCSTNFWHEVILRGSAQAVNEGEFETFSCFCTNSFSEQDIVSMLAIQTRQPKIAVQVLRKIDSSKTIKWF